MKASISAGVIIGGVVGGAIGAAMDHGNQFGLLSLGLSSVGSLLGIYIGYKAYQYFN